MMKQLLKMCGALQLLILAISVGFAQTEAQDTTMVLNPANFVPDPNGYFVAGVDKDKIGNDGVTEHYSGCDDAYGDSDHWEVGMQHGWSYDSVIIFNDCASWEPSNSQAGHAIKGTQPTENWPTNGDFIQIGKLKDIGTDSVQVPHIMSPAFTNLKSLTVKVSTDVSINGGRDIFMLIEASRDGEVWGYIDAPSDDPMLFDAYVIQKLGNQGGDIWTYEAGNPDFDNIIALSEDADSIMVRITSFPDLDRNKVNGERLKIWEATIEAQTVPETVDPGPILAIRNNTLNNAFEVRNGQFVSLNREELNIYNLTGRLIGSGEQVAIPRAGVYVVQTTSGLSSKISIRY